MKQIFFKNETNLNVSDKSFQKKSNFSNVNFI